MPTLNESIGGEPFDEIEGNLTQATFRLEDISQVGGVGVCARRYPKKGEKFDLIAKRGYVDASHAHSRLGVYKDTVGGRVIVVKGGITRYYCFVWDVQEHVSQAVVTVVGGVNGSPTGWWMETKWTLEVLP